MDCKHANEHLVDYLYQELDADEADRIEGHLRQCDGCSGELASFESTRRLMQQLPVLEPSASVTERLLREAERAMQPEAPGFWQRVRGGLQLLVLHPAMTAAVMLVLVLGVSFYAYRQSSPPARDGALPVPDEIGEAAPAGVPPAPVTPQASETPVGEQHKTDEVLRGAKDRAVLARPTPEPAADMLAGKHSVLLVKSPKGGAGATTVAKGRVARRPARRAKARPSTRYRKGPPANAYDDLDAPLARPRSANNGLGALAGGKRDGVTKKTGDSAPSPEPVAQAEEKERSGAVAWLTQARKANKLGKYEQALRLYHRALEGDPGLRRTVGPEVQRCARMLGLARLARAQKQLPLLAGWLEAEMSEARRREAHQQRAAKPAAKPAKPKAAPRAPAQRKSYSSPSAD